MIATAIFLPLEVHELLRRVTITRAGAFALNLAAVVYLVLAKRLFGARGGRRVYEHELHSQSLLEVEAAGSDTRYGRQTPSEPGRDVGMSDVSADKAESAAR